MEWNYSVAKYEPKKGSLLDPGVASFVEQQTTQHPYDHLWWGHKKPQLRGRPMVISEDVILVYNGSYIDVVSTFMVFKGS